MKCTLLLLALTATVQAAPITLALSSISGTPTQTVDLPLTLGGTPTAAALQWTLTYPAADLSSVTFSIGDAAVEADKMLQCGPDIGGSITCLIFGLNQTIIGTGSVATLSATIAQVPTNEIIPLTLSGVIAADPAGNAVDITGTGGSITVVPEPGTVSILILGLSFLVAARRFRLA